MEFKPINAMEKLFPTGTPRTVAYSGDAFVVYPTNNDVLHTMRLEILCAAVQDYRLCKLVEEKIGKEETLAILHAFGINGFNEYPRDITSHEKIRERLIDSIN